MKYSINSNGFIVAERDIYSLGGFIPKGSVGAKVANEDQISQDGECWVAGGDISTRPDVRVKDNAYIGTFTAGVDPVHTDGITEFSGNTIIPGNILVRSLVADTKNNFFAKDSFIGVSVKSLCGPRTTTTAFPFEQGGYLSTAPRGTAFSSLAIQTQNISLCRSTDSVIRCGLNTYVYLPTGYSGTILWAYPQGGTAVYSGESKVIPSGLTKIEHPVYKQFMLHINKIDGTAMTPTDLLATGAKILGHISGPLLQDIRPGSASGEYVMDNSSIIMNTDNFGLATTQLRFLAGSMYDTTMYTKTDRPDYKLYGTFRNVERLEYTKYLPDSHRTAATRDRYISVYDCPLLRVDDTTYNDALAAKGNLVLRNCIVPKAEFQDDVINGNTYEDIDFSRANEDLGYTIAGYTRFISSHKQGIYRLSGGPSSTGFVSHKGNLADTARLYQANEYTPLDGSIMEQGGYTATVGTYYENSKNTSAIRVRTGKPLPTFGAIFPTPPAGFKVTIIAYLGEDFKIQPSQVNPVTIETEYPYFVVVFGKADDSAISVTDFIALNHTLRMIDHTKAPEITGSAYVGAGCIVRGDVKLIGDPYVNRLLDVDAWERGSNSPAVGKRWDETFILPGMFSRFRLKNLVPVEPGGTVSRAVGGKLHIWYFDENGTYKGANSGWVTSVVIPNNVYYIGATIDITGDGLVTEDDIPLASVKYVRAFKKRRYIVNELDRTSPEDVFLTEDLWRVASFSTSPSSVGKPYKDLISTSDKWCILKRLFNIGPSRDIQLGNSDTHRASYSSWDASTKLLGRGITDGVALTGLEIGKKDGSIVTLGDVPAARLVLEFVPQPRIIAPYGVSNVWIEGTKVRMYDNSVVSRTITKGMGVILKGDAVMGSVFTGDVCMCSNGHGDAIINK